MLRNVSEEVYVFLCLYYLSNKKETFVWTHFDHSNKSTTTELDYV